MVGFELKSSVKESKEVGRDQLCRKERTPGRDKRE